MKIAVYAITRDEEQFVNRMIESIIDADEIVICDTGSTDNTVLLIQNWVDRFPEKIKLHHMHIKPWRFDIARNTSLSHVSADATCCLCLDLDEVMVAGWREKLEAAWVDGTTRCKYNYVWSWNGDQPAVSFAADKMHARDGYRWHHPVHEVLQPYMITEVSTTSKCEMHHFPDHTKSRGQYLPLLELSVTEDPADDRNAYYLGREYYFYKQYAKAIEQMGKYRALPTAKWNAERGSSWRIAGRCHLLLGDLQSALKCFLEAASECPEMRESWVELGECYYNLAMWPQCYHTCEKAISITEIPDVYITEREAYGSKAHDLLSVAAWNLGKVEVAIDQCAKAREFDPFDDRLKNNMEFMLQSQRDAKATTGSPTRLA